MKSIISPSYPSGKNNNSGIKEFVAKRNHKDFHIMLQFLDILKYHLMFLAISTFQSSVLLTEIIINVLLCVLF